MLRLREKKIKKVPKFLPEEDERLRNIISQIGTRNWVTVASMMPGRNVRQCIERWRRLNKKINPKREWTKEEDQILIEKYKIYGRKWALIVPFLSNRNESSIRTRFNQIYGKSEPIKEIAPIVEVPEKPIELKEIHSIGSILEAIEFNPMDEPYDHQWWNRSSEFQFL